MLILDIQEWKWFKEHQEVKFHKPASGLFSNAILRGFIIHISIFNAGPLVPMMRTPKFPVIIVRYTYSEGRPKVPLIYLPFPRPAHVETGRDTSDDACREQIDPGRHDP